MLISSGMVNVTKSREVCNNIWSLENNINGDVAYSATLKLCTMSFENVQCSMEHNETNNASNITNKSLDIFSPSPSNFLNNASSPSLHDSPSPAGYDTPSPSLDSTPSSDIDSSQPSSSNDLSSPSSNSAFAPSSTDYVAEPSSSDDTSSDVAEPSSSDDTSSDVAEPSSSDDTTDSSQTTVPDNNNNIVDNNNLRGSSPSSSDTLIENDNADVVAKDFKNDDDNTAVTVIIIVSSLVGVIGLIVVVILAMKKYDVKMSDIKDKTDSIKKRLPSRETIQNIAKKASYIIRRGDNNNSDGSTKDIENPTQDKPYPNQPPLPSTRTPSMLPPRPPRKPSLKRNIRESKNKSLPNMIIRESKLKPSNKENLMVI